MHPKSAPTNDKNPIGTGPFMFKERKEGDSITLVKSPTYRDPRLDQAQHGDLQDREGPVGAGERASRRRRRCLPGLPGARAGRAPEEGSALRRHRRHDRGRGDPGDQQRQEAVRQSQGAPGDGPRHQPRGADRSAESGFGVPIGSHFAPHNKAYIDLTKTYPFDIAKAKALLAEAGYPERLRGQPEAAAGRLRPARRRGDRRTSSARSASSSTITQLQWPQWLSEVFKERNYDLTIVAHTEANDLDRYARDGYYWGYNSPEFKAKWREVVAATDFAKRDAAPEGGAADHRPRCRERLPLPARQDRRVEEGPGRHVGELADAAARSDGRVLEVKAPASSRAKRGDLEAVGQVPRLRSGLTSAA